MTAVDSSSRGVGIDSRSLDTLRGEAARDPQGASRKVAVQFESLFMQMVLKSMRDATPKVSDQGMGAENFTSMLDAQFAKQFSGQHGGLADMVQKQLARELPNFSPASNAGTPPGGEAPNSLISGIPAKKPVSVQTDFMQRMAPHAKAAEAQTGVPASFILGQAALESGWGRSEIRRADGSPSFNLFGVKAGSHWKGDTTAAKTTEYVDGQPVKQVAQFRSYASYADAFADYARLLTRSPRYGDVVKSASTAEGFAGGLQRAGYATDPAYATKLTRTINLALAVQRSIA